MIIQCTQKLANSLPVSLDTIDSIAEAPIYRWHAHLFLFQRRKCVLLLNNVSRYNFVLFGLVKADFARFHALVCEQIASNLVADGVAPEQAESYVRQCGSSVVYTPTSDRSLIGQMNEMIMFADYVMKEETGSIDVEGLNRSLNRFVMLKLKTYSGEMMKDELEQLYRAQQRPYQ